jgi:hypothetical protein
MSYGSDSSSDGFQVAAIVKLVRSASWGMEVVYEVRFVAGALIGLIGI